ncbi:unnamed protein product [Phaedon cochleariae]|uniref:MADF domain-containing protein n=1 Tax=Phaedon cochleariae TaxID=80249 RepID=A0A9P0DDY5_PHACE|nr:unnamed protein product [Phaedon cochleariae]
MEAFNIKFVGEVEKYPELYNYTLQAYAKRDATRKAWNKVAREVKLSVNECKEKWRNLRSTFVKNLKPKPSRSGGKKKPYYLMEAMQFAVPFVKVAGTPTGNVPEVSQTLTSLSTPDVFDADDMEGEENESIDDVLDIHMSSPSPSPSSSATSSQLTWASQGDRAGTPTSVMPTVSKGPHGHPVRTRKVQSDAADKASSAYFSAKQAKLSVPPQPKNETDKREEGIKNFVMSLLPDLMQLNDVQLRQFKRKALLLIDEIDERYSVLYDSRALA